MRKGGWEDSYLRESSPACARPIRNEIKVEECSEKKAWCPATSRSLVKQVLASATSPLYSRMCNQLIAQSRPYEGEKVYVLIDQKRKSSHQCPMYSICLGRKWYHYSFSRKDFYIYLYLQEFKTIRYYNRYDYEIDNCVYLGDHITLGITEFNKDTLDIHLTLYDTRYADTPIRSGSVCHLSLSKIEDLITDSRLSKHEKVTSLAQMMCINKKGKKAEALKSRMEHDDRRTDNLWEYVEMLYYVFKKGLARPAPGRSGTSSP